MNDWPWPVVLALAVPPALGHVAHFVLLINVVSGLGYSESAADRVRRFVFGGFWVSSAALLWMHLQHPFWTWPWPLFGYAIVCVISGLIVVPLTSLYLALRRQPQGITGTSRTIDLALAKGRRALIGPGGHSWLLRLPGHHSFQLCLRDWELQVVGLPQSLDGFRILQLTSPLVSTGTSSNAS
jgi:uncharacterized protein